MSAIAKKMAGTWVEEDTTPKPPLLAWVQEQIRSGSLRATVTRFLDAQPEAVEIDRVLVESCDRDTILCRVVGVATDAESRKPVRLDIDFRLNPVSGHVERLGVA